MSAETQVLVKLVTKLPEELKVPEAAVAVPGSLKRYGLSQIVNHLLALDPPRPFDFLVNGELLRKALDVYMVEKEISAEATLEIEYIPAVVPPQQTNSAPHDDWVSCLDGSWGASMVVSGSYDGCIRLWTKGEAGLSCTLAVSAHRGGVNAVACLPLPGDGEDAGAPRCVATAGKDSTLKLWRLREEGGVVAECMALYSGHKDGVESVAVSPNGFALLSAGWDGSMFMWRAGPAVLEDAEEAAQSAAKPKKRKGGSEQAPALTEEPLRKLEGHLHCVSSVSYPTNEAAFSGGWDHSVRRWDIESGINTDTYNGSKMIACVASPSAAPSLVAFVGSDKVLRVWDTRSRKGESLAVQSHLSHTAWISSVAWAHGSPHHLATGSHDNSVKLWDVRTAVPLATLKQHTDKVLSVAYVEGSSGHILMSGGADCTLQLYESS